MCTRLFPVGALAAIIFFALVVIASAPGSARADEGHPGLNFYIAINGVPGCDTQDGSQTCDLAPATVFVIDVFLDPLPDDIPNYGGFDVQLGYTNLTANQDASTDAWPDCGFPAADYEPDVVVFACAVGVPPAPGSTYSGLIGTTSFVCSESGSVNLRHGINDTDLVEFENISLIHAENPSTNETLTINCVEGGVTPIPTTPSAGATRAPSATPLSPTEQAQATATAAAQATATAAAQAPGNGDDDDGGLSGVVIAIIIIAAVVVASGGGFLGWRYYQSRRGAGGAP